MENEKQETPGEENTPSETRVTFIVDINVLNKFKRVNKAKSYRLTIEQGQIVKSLIKEDFQEALLDYIKKYEATYSKVPD